MSTDDELGGLQFSLVELCHHVVQLCVCMSVCVSVCLCVASNARLQQSVHADVWCFQEHDQ